MMIFIWVYDNVRSGDPSPDNLCDKTFPDNRCMHRHNGRKANDCIQCSIACEVSPARRRASDTLGKQLVLSPLFFCFETSPLLKTIFYTRGFYQKAIMPHEVQPTHWRGLVAHRRKRSKELRSFAIASTRLLLNGAPLYPTTTIPNAMPGDYTYMRMFKALMLKRARKQRRQARRVVRTFVRTQLQRWFASHMNANRTICSGDDIA